MSMHPRLRWIQNGRRTFVALLVGSCVACGPGEELELDEDTSTLPLGGISTNGLSSNGLSSNGLSTNGLSTNGLSSNGLSSLSTGWSTKFKTWCNSHISDGLCNNVMTYVVKCACNAGVTRSYSGSASYSWAGQWGVADGFCSGTAATVAEQERMTACLLAHVNGKAGSGFSMSVSLSAKWGNSAYNINRDSREEEVMNRVEAWYFGNLWQDKKYYSSSFSHNAEDDRLMGHYGRNCGFGGCWGTGFTEPSGVGCFMENDAGLTGSPYATMCRDTANKAWPAVIVRLGNMARGAAWQPDGMEVVQFSVANGAAFVTASDGQKAVSIPYDVDTAPAKLIGTQTYSVFAGYVGLTHRVQVGYFNSTGATQACTIKVTHSGGTATKTVNATFPSGTGALVRDVSADFVPTSSSVLTAIAQSTPGTTAKCPLISSILIGLR